MAIMLEVFPSTDSISPILIKGLLRSLRIAAASDSRQTVSKSGSKSIDAKLQTN